MEGNKYAPETLVRLPREELRRILTEELHKDTEQIDDAVVRLLLAELQTRGCDPAFTDDDVIVATCEKFRQNTESMQRPRKRWYQSWILKVASVVLALGILFFALPTAAQAGNVQNVLGWWSDSVFQFLTPGKKPLVQEYMYETDHPGLQQLYDMVTESGINDPIVPSWVPEGFETVDLQMFLMDTDASIYTCLVHDSNYISMTIVVCDNAVTFQHEKDDKNILVWNLAGTEHYVLSNNTEQIVTWVVNGIECTITTDCPEEDVYKIIKSIYTSED